MSIAVPCCERSHDYLILRRSEYDVAGIHGVLDGYREVFRSTVDPATTARFPSLQTMLVLARDGPGSAPR